MGFHAGGPSGDNHCCRLLCRFAESSLSPGLSNFSALAQTDLIAAIPLSIPRNDMYWPCYDSPESPHHISPLLPLKHLKLEKMTPSLESPAPPKRQLIWGGLAARCSDCGWNRVYEPRKSVHRLPVVDLASEVQKEFYAHTCEKFSKNDGTSSD